jgi:anti-sigma regulatory factor (Ser/Thr protein kinase)
MTTLDQRSLQPFCHEALLYSSEREFVEGTTAFLRDGIAHDDAMLTVVDATKIRAIRGALGTDAERVQFADMALVGRNPALIIQAWKDFAHEHGSNGRSLRGIGEPISPARDPAALVECQIHESLLNLAFHDQPNFWLVCPYDTVSLPASVIEVAADNHPFVCNHVGTRSPGAPAVEHATGLTQPLPAPPASTDEMRFEMETITDLRRFVSTRAEAAGIDSYRVAELAVAASEIATNAVVHGHGGGRAGVWTDDHHLVCEIRGPGHIDDPLVGRLRPTPGEPHGYGIWLANQFCDLVQIRSGDGGTTVRLHIARI